MRPRSATDLTLDGGFILRVEDVGGDEISWVGHVDSG
jgi:hypothetical protein